MSLRRVVASGARVGPPGWLADNLCYETTQRRLQEVSHRMISAE